MRRSLPGVLVLLPLLCFGAAPRVWAQDAGAIRGVVSTLEGAPVPDAVVLVVELRRQMPVEADGSFHFDEVPAGAYLVQATSPRLGRAVERVTVQAGATLDMRVALDLTVHQDEILVTASPDARSRSEVAQPTSVLAGEELQRQLQPSLGETLNREPGVTSSFYGPAASRPVIRGLGGDRIRVLQSGLGSGDAAVVSPDHAVTVEAATAERIEVIRGPATLLYGSSAVGGVVNVIDNRIPERLPDRRLTGSADVRAGTVADERGGSLLVEGALGRVAWHADYQRRETGDMEIPGFAESAARRQAEEGEAGEDEDEEAAFGVLENSAIEGESGSVGLSWVRDQGFFGVSTSGFNTFYGVPGESHHEEEGGEEVEAQEEEGEGAQLDLEHRRWDLRGGINRPFGIFRGASLRFGVTDYEHREFEGGAGGTIFANESWEGRFDLLQRAIGPLTGAIGIQVQSRDFQAIGDEVFVPPTETDSRAIFAFEELTRGAWRLQVGARYETQDTTAAFGAVRDRSFEALSGSVGLVWQTADQGYTAGLSVARSAKLPNAEELFTDGPHLATHTFEIGDPDLQEETSSGFDLTLRKGTGRLSGELTFFLNRFADYIFLEATGEEEDGLPVFQYVQLDADFRGAELSGVVQLVHTEPYHLDLDLGADFVRAELTETGAPLPRIPPARYRLGLHLRGGRLDGQIEGLRVEEQDRISEFELPTEGYTLLNASVVYRFFASNTVYSLMLRGNNLTDEEARNHVSFLKDLAPMPGRDVSLSLRVAF